MKICKHFKKDDKTGTCKNYAGDRKESCRYNCKKLKKIGTKYISKLEIAVD